MTKEELTKQIINFINNPENKINNFVEEVADELYYSKAIRVICVLDENFDDFIDGYLSIFYADTVGKTDYEETYSNAYGDITISQKEDSSVTVKFDAEGDNLNDRKN